MLEIERRGGGDGSGRREDDEDPGKWRDEVNMAAFREQLRLMRLWTALFEGMLYDLRFKFPLFEDALLEMRFRSGGVRFGLSGVRAD